MVVKGGDRAQHAIPEREIIGEVVLELRVMLVVIGRAQHGRGIARGLRGEIFETGMAEGAVDLVEQPVGKQDHGRKRHDEDDHRIKALRQGGIDKPDRIVAPDGRRDAAMMLQMVLVEVSGVEQPVGEVEPGVEQHHAQEKQGDGGPPAERPGLHGPTPVLGEEADRHGKACDEDGGEAQADFGRLALFAAPVLLDAAFRVAVVQPGYAMAEQEIDRDGCAVEPGEQNEEICKPFGKFTHSSWCLFCRFVLPALSGAEAALLRLEMLRNPERVKSIPGGEGLCANRLLAMPPGFV